MSQNVSLIVDGTLPLEVEQFILTNYLGATDLVKYRLVRKSASVFLDEAKFKELFRDRHPFLCKRDKPLEIQFKYLCDIYPSKCWKVASCVFETGNLKFCDSFINEGIKIQVKNLEDQINHLEAELEKVCGKGWEDPVSPIRQA